MQNNRIIRLLAILLSETDDDHKLTTNQLIDILDYFGHEIKTTNAEKGYFNAIIEIELSPTFYAWIFQFEGDIIIQSPQNAIDDFIKTAEMIIEEHNRKGAI